MARGERRRSAAGVRASLKSRRLAGPVVSSRVRSDSRQEARIENGSLRSRAKAATTGARQAGMARRSTASARVTSNARAPRKKAFFRSDVWSNVPRVPAPSPIRFPSREFFEALRDAMRAERERYDDPDGHDKLYRFAESIQEFLDLSARVDYVYPDGSRPPARRDEPRRSVP